MSERLETLQRLSARGASRRSLLKAASIGALGLTSIGVRREDTAAVTCPSGGESCRNDGDSTAGGACCVGTCARGNAGNGVGGNTCTYAVRECNNGRTCVVTRQGFRCRR